MSETVLALIGIVSLIIIMVMIFKRSALCMWRFCWSL